jgi:hypothetical protein
LLSTKSPLKKVACEDTLEGESPNILKSPEPRKENNIKSQTTIIKTEMKLNLKDKKNIL